MIWFGLLLLPLMACSLQHGIVVGKGIGVGKEHTAAAWAKARACVKFVKAFAKFIGCEMLC